MVCEGQAGVTGTAPDQAPWWVTLFTSMFMHASLIHLAGNMLFLWIFGNNIEDSMGPARFIGFYLLGGLAAIGAQTLVDPNAAVPTVGASGAIAAVLGGYALLYPRARVITVVFIIIFFTIIELPALVVLGFWILVQVWLGASQFGPEAAGGSGGVAYFAHIGGLPVRAACHQTVRRSRARGLRALPPPAGLLMAARTAVLAGTLAIIGSTDRPYDRGRGRGRHQRFGGGRNAAGARAARIRRVRRAVVAPAG